MSGRIGLRKVLLSSWSLLCIFCNLAAPRGSGGDEGFGMLGTVWTWSEGQYWNEKLGGFFQKCSPRAALLTRGVLGGWEIAQMEQGVRSGPVQPWALQGALLAQCWKGW